MCEVRSMDIRKEGADIMKKTKRVIGMLAGTFAIIGIVLIVVGALMGGIKVVSSDVMSGRLTIGSDAVVGVDVFTDEDYDNMTSIEERSTFDSAEVKEVEFEAEYGEFQIVSWEHSYYEIKGESSGAANRIKYALEDGALKLRMKGKRVSVFGDNVKATLYVPEDAVIDKFRIEVGAGELLCKDISGIQRLKVNIGAGEGKFSNITADYVDMSVGAGDGNVENAQFGNSNFNVGVGDLDVHGMITGNVVIDCGIGNMDVELANSYDDFNYKVSVGLGEVSLNEEKYSGFIDNREIDNEEDKKITIRCGIGDVSVDFNKALYD